VKEFKGTHYVGGRFIPDEVFERFNVEKPKYEGYEQFAKL